jgi:hypothetical protein
MEPPEPTQSGPPPSPWEPLFMPFNGHCCQDGATARFRGRYWCFADTRRWEVAPIPVIPEGVELFQPICTGIWARTAAALISITVPTARCWAGHVGKGSSPRAAARRSAPKRAENQMVALRGSSGGRPRVMDGNSSKSARYSAANRPNCQKPYCVAISVTVVAVGALARSPRRTRCIRRSSKYRLGLTPSCSWQHAAGYVPTRRPPYRPLE